MYDYWDKDDHFLEVPMISPRFIPLGYMQYWDIEQHRWLLKKKKGTWGKLTIHLEEDGTITG